MNLFQKANDKLRNMHNMWHQWFLTLIYEVVLKNSKKYKNSNRKMGEGCQETIQNQRNANDPLTYKKIPKLPHK